jgi:hypothetical protein
MSNLIFLWFHLFRSASELKSERQLYILYSHKDLSAIFSLHLVLIGITTAPSPSHYEVGGWR